MAATRKASAVTVSGTLARVTLKDARAVDWNYSHRYSPASEHRCVYLDCELRGDDGRTYYFATPRSNYNVACVPGAAVVTYSGAEYDEAAGRYVFPADHPWYRLEGTNAVATPGIPNDTRLVPAVNPGDRVTIRGTVKAERVSRHGNPYTTLSRVTRIIIDKV